MELQTRRHVGFAIRIALILATFGIIGVWVWSRVPSRGPVSVQREAPPVEALGPGDIQIVSIDGKIDAILKGDKIMAGLSPATVAKVRADMEKSSAGDSSGLGGMIGGIVKSSVASAIGTHITYPVSEVKSLTFDGRQLVLVTQAGKTHRLFGDDKSAGRKEPAAFSKEDAERFIAAVNARKAELRIP